MRRLLKKPYLWILLGLVLLSAGIVLSQEEAPPSFPTDKQILTVVDHAKAALALNDKAIVARTVLDPEGMKQIAKFSQGLDRITDMLGQQPQLFNSPLGFEWIWDMNIALHNSMWCFGSAEMERRVALFSAFPANKTPIENIDVVAASSACLDSIHPLILVSQEASQLYAEALGVNASERRADKELLKDCKP
jgi:hypothetical protein